MKPAYTDITKRLGKAHWYDEHGVPRYEPFEYGYTSNIYNDVVVLLEIACQACGERFKVEMGYSSMDLIMNRYTKGYGLVDVPLPTVNGPWAFHYGDPPIHACIGDTMNSVPVRVIEFWKKGDHFEWERLPDQEITWPEEEE